MRVVRTNRTCATSTDLDSVNRYTAQVAGSWRLPPGAAAVRAGLGSLWVTISTADQLVRIDPADPTPQTPIDVGGLLRFLGVGEDAVWVMNQRDGLVTRVAADDSAVWVSAHDVEAIWRLPLP